MAIDVVRRLTGELLPGATVSWRDTSGGTDVTVEAGGELVCSAYVPAGLAAREAVAHVVGLVQDAATERLGRAVPECPGDAHPASLRVTDVGVAWTCPVSGRVLETYAVPPADPGCGTLGG